MVKQNDNVSTSTIQKHLGGIDYPIHKDKLIQHAKDDGASEEVMAILEQMPKREYTSPVDVNKEIGKLD